MIVDLQGCVSGMSRGARQLTGETSVTMESAPALLRFAELFRPREWEAVHRWVTSGFVEGAQPPDGSFVARAKNGAAIRLRRMDISNPEYSSISLERVEELSRPREVHEVEAELRQVLDWLDEGVVVFDENGRIRAKNARFLQILGLGADVSKYTYFKHDLI